MDFWLEVGQICKNNDHKCLFHCITHAESLSRCWNTWSNGLIFKQLPWEPENVNALKTHVWSLYSKMRYRRTALYHYFKACFNYRVCMSNSDIIEVSTNYMTNQWAITLTFSDSPVGFNKVSSDVVPCFFNQFQLNFQLCNFPHGSFSLAVKVTDLVVEILTFLFVTLTENNII